MLWLAPIIAAVSNLTDAQRRFVYLDCSEAAEHAENKSNCLK